MYMILRICIFCLGVFFLTHLSANDARNLVREGNRLFDASQYAEAEAKYRAALEMDQDNADALFNLGNALYRQGHLDEAQAIFESLSQDFEDEQRLADALHNLGNSYLGQQRIPESMEAYKDALRISPDQDDTRYNLAFARRLLEDMPPQEQPQEGDGPPEDKEEDQEDNGQSQPAHDDDPESDEDNGEEEQPATPEPGPMDDVEDDSPARLDELSKEDAERMLDALRREEERIQQQVNRDDTIPDTLRIRKDW